MKCKQCGNKLEKTACFCTKCGNKIEKESKGVRKIWNDNKLFRVFIVGIFSVLIVEVFLLLLFSIKNAGKKSDVKDDVTRGDHRRKRRTLYSIG